MRHSFTKLWKSITESTVWQEPDGVRLVWITMLAMADWQGFVWASMPGLAHRARVSLEDTELALSKFLAPDPYSRTKEFEGRRIQAVEGGWKLLNYERHRALRNEEAAKDAKRRWWREHRSKAAKLDRSLEELDQTRTDSNHIDVRCRKEPRERPRARASSSFAPPTIEEVREYVRAKGYTFDPEAFISYYEARGWKIKGEPIESWKACCVTWMKREQARSAPPPESPPPPGSLEEAIERKRQKMAAVAAKETAS